MIGLIVNMVEHWYNCLGKLLIYIGWISRYFEENWATIHWYGEDSGKAITNEVLVRYIVSR